MLSPHYRLLIDATPGISQIEAGRVLDIQRPNMVVVLWNRSDPSS
jgi:hypothetical protein